MIGYDYHLHTSYSPDSQEPMEEVVKRAVALGLKEIAITDHWDYIYPDHFFPYQTDYEEYAVVFNGLKEKYADRINIVFGVEIGVGPHLGDTVAAFAERVGFDFIIGSIHAIKDQDLYYNQYFKNLSKREAYTGYFEYFLDSVKAVKEICVAGHLDFISRYGPYSDPAVWYEDFKAPIDNLLKGLIERGKGIEINTSGYRYGINAVYPQLAILKRYRELGGEILTVGSDAHKAADIAKNFGEARAVLEEAGFRYITVFRQRKPEFIKI
jgi:histidinol-phosphatase (PHP family)